MAEDRSQLLDPVALTDIDYEAALALKSLQCNY